MKLVEKKLAELLFFQEGPGVRKFQFRESGVKLLNGRNINNNVLDLSTTKRYISNEEANGRYSHFLVDEGDLVVASSGITVSKFDGKIAFVRKEDLPLLMNTSTIRFKTLNNELDILYFSFFLRTNHFKNQIQKLITGSAQLNFGPSHLKKINVIYPNLLSNQKRIAKILFDCEQLIRYREESLKLLDSYLESTFLQIFGDPILNTQHFKTKKLEELASISRGKFTPRPRNDPKYFGGQYPFIQTGDISKADIYLNKFKQTLNEYGKKVSKEFPKDTVVIALVGATIGETAILDIKCFAPDSIVGIIPKSKEINSIYLQFVLNFWKPILRSKAPQAARANINNETIKPIKIVIPPSKKLNKFSKIALKTMDLKKQFKNSLVELENLFGIISQKAFNGKLDLSKVIIEDTSVSTIEKGIADKGIKRLSEKPLLNNQLKTNVKRDIRNISLMDYFEIPIELYKDKIADDYGPELDFINDDLFYQFYLKDTFKTEPFTFLDLESKFNSYYIPKGKDFDPVKWKSIIFKYLEAKKPLIEQSFEEESGTIKLKLTDEAFKA